MSGLKKQYENRCCVCSKDTIGPGTTHLGQGKLLDESLIFKILGIDAETVKKYDNLLTKKVCKSCSEALVAIINCRYDAHKFYKKLDELKIFICDICWSKFYSENDLIEHKKSHSQTNTEEVPMEIDSTCNGLVTVPVPSRRQSSISEAPNICSYCERIFPPCETKTYTRHLSHEREVNREKEKCLLCKKVFKNLYFLAKHIADNHIPEIENQKQPTPPVCNTPVMPVAVDAIKTEILPNIKKEVESPIP